MDPGCKKLSEGLDFGEFELSRFTPFSLQQSSALHNDEKLLQCESTATAVPQTKEKVIKGL